AATPASRQLTPAPNGGKAPHPFTPPAQRRNPTPMVAVVPAEVATTALDRCCRPDDSTRYFAVVGRRARSQASAEVIRPNHLNRPDVEPMLMDNAKTLSRILLV